jgi:protein-tyrosine phosphatase
MCERTLRWDGCLNVRDLGGHPTEDGGETLWGSVIRADSVRTLSREGWASLAAHGVRTIVDLRSDAERAEDGPDEALVDVVHVSVMAEPGDPVYAEMDTAARVAGARGTEVFYLRSLDLWGDRFAAAVDAVGAAPPGGVAIHCQAGKDRTGLVVAFLLRLAGVSAGDVASDYALSSENLRPRWHPWVEEAENEEERRLRVRMSATPAEAMLGVLASLEREHGSIEGFLRFHGLNEGSVDRARARRRG